MQEQQEQEESVMTRLIGTIVGFVALACALLWGAPVGRGLAQEDGATPARTPLGDTVMGMGMSGMGAAYMVIRNGRDEVYRLIGGKTVVARIVEIHEMADVNSIMEMRPLADGLDIPAGGEATLEPGGYHVMLIDLTEDLRDGTTYDLTLKFERAGRSPCPSRCGHGPRSPLTPRRRRLSSLVRSLSQGAWSRPAPALDEMAKPEATPAS